MDLNLPKARTMVFDAPISKRVLAFLVDLLLIEVLIVSPFAPVFPRMDESAVRLALSGGGLPMTPLLYVVLLCVLVLAWLYFSLFQYVFAQTPGMMLLRITLEGGQSFGRCLVRNLFVFPIFPFFLLWIIEPLYLLLRRRTWLEQLTGARVVEHVSLT